MLFVLFVLLNGVSARVMRAMMIRRCGGGAPKGAIVPTPTTCTTNLALSYLCDLDLLMLMLMLMCVDIVALLRCDWSVKTALA